MANEAEAADYVENPVYLGRSEANVVARVVKLSEASQAAEDYGAAFQRWEEVFMDEVAEVFQTGCYGLVPTLMTL